MFKLNNKWALVTGASRGIGNVISHALADQGCNLLLHSRDVQNLRQLQLEVEEKGIKALLIEQDFGQKNAVEQLMDKIDALNIPIDILINNAGINLSINKEAAGLSLAINDWNQEEYELTSRVNLVVPALLSAKILPQMLKRNFGCIISMTSDIHGSDEHFIYSITKGAINKMTRDLAEIVEGTGVCVSAVEPGWCQTYLGGARAVCKAENVAPGILIPIFSQERANGKIIHAQKYAGMTLDKALSVEIG